MATQDPRVAAAFKWMASQTEPTTVAQIKQRFADVETLADMKTNSIEVELVTLASSRFVQLSKIRPAFAYSVPEAPCVRLFARLQLRSTGDRSTTLRGEVIQVAGVDQPTMMLLDGSRDAAAVAAELKLSMAEVDATLERLRKSSFLLA